MIEGIGVSHQSPDAYDEDYSVGFKKLIHKIVYITLDRKSKKEPAFKTC